MIRYDKILINLDSRIDRHRSSTKLAGLLNFLALGWLRAARLPRRGLLWQRQALVAPPGNTGSAYAISIAPSGIGRANRRASSNCTGLLHQKYAVFSARQFGCGSSLRASRLPRLVLRQQRVEKTLTIIETRRLEPREGGGKIDKALARRKRSSNPNVPVTAKPRCRAAVTPSWSSISNYQPRPRAGLPFFILVYDNNIYRMFSRRDRLTDSRGRGPTADQWRSCKSAFAAFRSTVSNPSVNRS